MAYVFPFVKMGDEIDEIELQLNNLELEAENIITIVIGETTLTCGSQLLKEHSTYFEAFFNFTPDLLEVNLKEGVEAEACATIIEYFKDGNLNINQDNFQDLLQGAIFLQSVAVENLCISYITQRLGLENVFSIYEFSRVLGSIALEKTTKFYIENVFNVILRLTTDSAKVEDFLCVDVDVLDDELHRDIQCSEDTLLFGLLGWINHSPERKVDAERLISGLNLILLSKPTLVYILEDEQSKDVLQSCLSQIKQSLKFHVECLDWQKRFVIQQLEEGQMKTRRQKKEKKRWPRIIIGCGSGSAKGRLQYLDLRPGRSSSWKQLTRWPQELKQGSTGHSVVHLHPRLYFLGGERRWRVHWFDLEENSWGVEDGGPPPPRLLAATATVNNKILLIGGVSVEEWERGSVEVVTSNSVDVYTPSSTPWDSVNSLSDTPLDSDTSLTHCDPLTWNPVARTSFPHFDPLSWNPVARLPEEMSRPSVAVFNGQIYVFGGLRKRSILRSCYTYTGGGWESLPPIPADVSYPAVVVDEHRGVVWLLGGMGADCTARTETFMYSPAQRSWSPGPKLNVPRASALGFVKNGDVFVCGGNSDDLKHLESSEILHIKSDKWVISPEVKNWHSLQPCVLARLPVRLLHTS